MISRCQDEPSIFSQAKSFRLARRGDAPACRRPGGRTLWRRGFRGRCRRRLCLRVLGHGRLRCLPRLDADVSFLTTGDVDLNHPGPEMIWIEKLLGKVGGLKWFDIKNLKGIFDVGGENAKHKSDHYDFGRARVAEMLQFCPQSVLLLNIVVFYPLYNPQQGWYDVIWLSDNLVYTYIGLQIKNTVQSKNWQWLAILWCHLVPFETPLYMNIYIYTICNHKYFLDNYMYIIV